MNELTARVVLCMMVLDMGYTYAPTHGHRPIRHQMIWKQIEDVLGEDEVKRQVQEFLADQNNEAASFPRLESETK
jgi:hypothetical protein